MAYTKQQKITLLANAFERRRKPRVEGETDAQYVQRVTQEHLTSYKEVFLKNTIQEQERFESVIDVSDL